MARGYGMALLAAISVVYLIHSSSAQTNYTVGDATGWTVPQTDPALYSTWAANKTFKVGDILVFNFSANIHNVATVQKADYDACTASSPISLSSTPPVRIPINASGEHYYLCSVSGHCSAGQKLMINVGDASSSPAPQPSATPAPQPSTPPSSSPSPASTPAPATSPPASTPAPATSPPPPTPAPATSPVSTPPPTPAPGTSPPPPTPAPGTPPPPPPTTAPPPNSAASLGFAGFTTFLSIFVALCY